ncbi:MAG TPA: 3-hydroxyacyl-ACP dehydratase FabZ family protein [Thermoanaerobaculia bacterium]
MISGTSLPDIFELLPHRFPFLLVDRITGIDPGRRAEGIKRVTGNEWFLGEATLDVAPPRDIGMPNGLVVEALAQLSAAVLIGVVDSASGAVGYFMGLDRVRYRGTVRAGDDLRLAVELRQFRRGVCRLHGDAWVGDRRVVRADLTIVVLPAA